MTGDEILAHLEDMMVELFEVPRAAIHPQARLQEDLDLDSIDAVDMAAQLHKLTGQSVAEGELRQVKTVADVVLLVQRQLGTEPSRG